MVKRCGVTGPPFAGQLGDDLDEAQIAQREHGAGHIREGDNGQPDDLGNSRVFTDGGPQLRHLAVDGLDRLAGHGGGNVETQVEGENRIRLVDSEAFRRHGPDANP